MKHFLSILLRNQFNLFYRFGYTYIPKCQLLEFDGEISYSTKENLIKLFSETTPFEWEEEYLIIHFDKNELIEGEVYKFHIQDIVKVYPLSAQAKSSIETKIDQRIKLEKPVFENILPEVEQTIEKHELEKAIEALWNVCDIDDDLNKYITTIGLDNIFNGLQRRKKGTKPIKIEDGNYWEYVLAYDRYDYFPNSTLGYFYDAGQIFAYSKGLPTFEGSGLHKFLQSINSSEPNIKIKDIVRLLETEDQGKNYVSQTTSKEQLQYLITPLYLILKEEIKKEEDIYNSNLFKNIKFLKEFGTSFNYAIILLGAFFGFKKFYDVYYNHLNLRFYKSHQPKIEKKEETEIIVPLENTLIETTVEAEVNPIQEESESISIENRAFKLETENKNDKEIPKIENSNKQEDVELFVETQGNGEEVENPTNDTEVIEKESEMVVHLKSIIKESLKDKEEIKITDIGNIYKEKTGKKISNEIIKNAINTMENISYFKKQSTDFASVNRQQRVD